MDDETRLSFSSHCSADNEDEMDQLVAHQMMLDRVIGL